jgi:hypothetical protein
MAYTPHYKCDCKLTELGTQEAIREGAEKVLQHLRTVYLVRVLLDIHQVASHYSAHFITNQLASVTRGLTSRAGNKVRIGIIWGFQLY